MPFTPYHFGPGLLVKAALRDRFSFAAYALAEVVIDTEVLINIIQRRRPLHGKLHTLVGAVATGLVIGIALHLVGRYLLNSYPKLKQKKWLHIEFALPATLLGGVMSGIGGSLLDALMHADVELFWPFYTGNPLIDATDANIIYIGCILSAIVGALILLWRVK
jgi:hypothetical protein